MKIESRKLWVFLLATLGVIFNFISEDTWLILACVYIGVQGTQDILKSFKNGNDRG